MVLNSCVFLKLQTDRAYHRSVFVETHGRASLQWKQSLILFHAKVFARKNFCVKSTFDKLIGGKAVGGLRRLGLKTGADNS